MPKQGFIARIRTWAALKLLGAQGHDARDADAHEVSELRMGAMQCADMCNGRMVIVYETDRGPYVRKFGMTHEQMLMTLRSSADQIDMATAVRSTKH